MAMPGAALLADAVNLDGCLLRPEIPCRGDLFEQRLDVRAQKLRRRMAGRADEMKVPRVAVRRLEARAPFAEVDLACNAGTDQPLQRAVDRRTADARRLAADEIEQIVGADVPLLTEEHLQHPVAFAGALAPRGTQRGEVRELSIQSSRL
jgi:hypothetical protein